MWYKKAKGKVDLVIIEYNDSNDDLIKFIAKTKQGKEIIEKFCLDTKILTKKYCQDFLSIIKKEKINVEIINL